MLTILLNIIFFVELRYEIFKIIFAVEYTAYDSF